MMSPVAKAVRALRDIQPGDTVFVGRTPRLVRAVGRDARGHVRSLTLAIRRCSWTRRPYTVYVRSDFYGIRPSGWPRVALRTRGDRTLARCIAAKASAPSALSCCDVRGWP